jgi:hypothetical protein
LVAMGQLWANYPIGLAAHRAHCRESPTLPS